MTSNIASAAIDPDKPNEVVLELINVPANGIESFRVTYQFDHVKDFCVLDMFCEDSLPQLESNTWVTSASYKYKTVLQYDCGPGRQFSGLDTQALNYTCGWDGNWDLPQSQPACECKGLIYALWQG